MKSKKTQETLFDAELFRQPGVWWRFSLGASHTTKQTIKNNANGLEYDLPIRRTVNRVSKVTVNESFCILWANIFMT